MRAQGSPVEIGGLAAGGWTPPQAWAFHRGAVRPPRPFSSPARGAFPPRAPAGCRPLPGGVRLAVIVSNILELYPVRGDLADYDLAALRRIVGARRREANAIRLAGKARGLTVPDLAGG